MHLDSHQIWIHPHPVLYTTTTCPYMYSAYITISDHYVLEKKQTNIQPINVLKMFNMHLI
jgi:hypothetical protein